MKSVALLLGLLFVVPSIAQTEEKPKTEKESGKKKSVAPGGGSSVGNGSPKSDSGKSK